MVSSIALVKYSNLDDTTFKCCFKSADISSIYSATVFLVEEIALNKCVFSGQNFNCFYKAQFYEISVTIRFPNRGDYSTEFIAYHNRSDVPFLNFYKTKLMLCQVIIQFLESWNTHLAFIFIIRSIGKCLL